MLSKYSFSHLSISERQVLRRQWLRSGQCMRCFRTSAGRRVEENGKKDSNDAGRPFNAPQRGPTRQQRSAMISEEVKMIQRDHPSPSFRDPVQDNARPSGASQTVDSGAVGQNVAPGRMGENAPASREGPEAQGTASPIRTDEEVADGGRIATRLEAPHDHVEEQIRSGSSLAHVDSERARSQKATRSPEHDQNDGDEENYETNHNSKLTARRQMQQDTSIAPSQQTRTHTRNEFLCNGNNTSTIAAANFEGVIQDRIKQITEPGQREDRRDPSSLAQKMMRGQLVRFESQAEKAAVEEEAKYIAERLARNFARQGDLSEDDVQPTAGEHSFASVPGSVRESLVERLVQGRYDQDALLEGKQKYKQPVLNEIAKMTLKNGTYLSSDGERFLRKVRSLLPSVQTTQQQQKAGALRRQTK